jgi:hypothetical protein
MGYITRACYCNQYCICGASLATHEGGQCPGPSSDPRAAVERLLESLQGKKQLSMMERMGRSLFISM